MPVFWPVLGMDFPTKWDKEHADTTFGKQSFISSSSSHSRVSHPGSSHVSTDTNEEYSKVILKILRYSAKTDSTHDQISLRPLFDREDEVQPTSGALRQRKQGFRLQFFDILILAELARASMLNGKKRKKTQAGPGAMIPAVLLVHLHGAQ